MADVIKPQAQASVYTLIPSSLTPIEVNGFYRVSGPREITFYATTDWPGAPLGVGWTVEGATGILGRIQLTGAYNIQGPGFRWYFTIQSDTEQNIQGFQQATGAIIYPPGFLAYKTAQTQTPIYGYYRSIQGITKFNFIAPPPVRTAPGWIVTGLPTVPVPCKITAIEKTTATLEPVDGSAFPETIVPVFVSGVPALVQPPTINNDFVPAKITSFREEDRGTLPETKVDINNIETGGYPIMRDLGVDVDRNVNLFAPSLYIEERGKGFSSGSMLALQAIGPQEKYLLTDDATASEWNPTFKRYSNFVMYQKTYPFPPPNPTYQGSTVQIELRPTEMGHLLSNMYLAVSLPASIQGQSVFRYTDHVGRALIKQVDLLVNETIVETIYDDWFVMRDQMFLDADEQLGIYQALGQSNITSTTQTNIVIPLEFFFCRRHSHANKDRERLRRPYFPLCAMWNQRLYVRFTFHPNTWWCNAPTSYGVDMFPFGTTQWPTLITEEILLENPEKLYYQHTPLRYIVNRIQKESTLPFTSQSTILQLTASFPVQTIAWFFRNKNYENASDPTLYNVRYSYGYTTQFIKTGIALQFPSGNSNYVNVINNAKITLNNVDILSTFQGSLYYSFKQPMEHGLSIPSKNIYTYSFGLSPKEYNQGGYLNFSKLNSQTTTLTINFLPNYLNQIVAGYNLYLFYYGYTLLQFQGGFASLPMI
jgi:hypothetical protein